MDYGLQIFWNAVSIEKLHIWIMILLKNEDHAMDLIDNNNKSVWGNELVPPCNKPLLEQVLSKKNDGIWHS